MVCVCVCKKVSSEKLYSRRVKRTDDITWHEGSVCVLCVCMCVLRKPCSKGPQQPPPKIELRAAVAGRVVSEGHQSVRRHPPSLIMSTNGVMGNWKVSDCFWLCVWKCVCVRVNRQHRRATRRRLHQNFLEHKLTALLNLVLL